MDILDNKERIKKLISIYVDRYYLVKTHRKDYLNYYKYGKGQIYSTLKGKGIINIKPINKHIWKLWYNTCYFSGELKTDKKRVFVKVMGKYGLDCYENEVIVNKYIEKNSAFLSERMPKILFSCKTDDYYFIVYSYLELSDITLNDDFYKELNKTIEEYSRIGILHTDFGLTNMGYKDGKYYFIDYGTSLCPESDNIRFRNQSNYNHIDRMSSEAKMLIDTPDFYYDDLSNLDLALKKEDNVNFIVSKQDIAYAKLGERIYKYKVKRRAKDSNVFLLIRQQ